MLRSDAPVRCRGLRSIRVYREGYWLRAQLCMVWSCRFSRPTPCEQVSVALLFPLKSMVRIIAVILRATATSTAACCTLLRVDLSATFDVYILPGIWTCLTLVPDYGKFSWCLRNCYAWRALNMRHPDEHSLQKENKSTTF